MEEGRREGRERAGQESDGNGSGGGGGSLRHPVTDLADLLHYPLVVPDLARARRHDAVVHLAFLV